jgi:hypothetical protein
MVTWMSCHDAVWRYEMFLRWARGNGIIEEEDAVDDNGDEPKSKQQRKEDDEEVTGCRGYKVAKIPGYGNMTVDALVNLHATDEHFLWYLEEFLLAHSLPIPPSHDVPFGVFKCLSVMLP